MAFAISRMLSVIETTPTCHAPHARGKFTMTNPGPPPPFTSLASYLSIYGAFRLGYCYSISFPPLYAEFGLCSFSFILFRLACFVCWGTCLLC
ncbi:hypothetical protein M407DRAFT_243027 [Tulasnella calospora MUT 4182]|uniref:Uncharacterized protein n=1 Tax=Tulasnella calospora MUT 4182 TaxID=1051891 RepID=A0A0C3M3X1_9AGAM|nr:hypothetical protein M407DRAFT_243027 [Tulasnella calospora MUT 4182]